MGREDIGDRKTKCTIILTQVRLTAAQTSTATVNKVGIKGKNRRALQITDQYRKVKEVKRSESRIRFQA